MTTTQKTRVKCSDGAFHTVEFRGDGTVISNGCTDITEEAQRVAIMLRLGRAPTDPSTCACLAALVTQGCEIILRRTPTDDGYQPLDGWRDVYVRFETNKVVKQTMARVRRRLHRERKAMAGGAS